MIEHLKDFPPNVVARKGHVASRDYEPVWCPLSRLLSSGIIPILRLSDRRLPNRGERWT